MPSREWWLLLRKELQELANSRSWWLLLVLVGLLVGHAFIDATSSYAEASGAGGGPAALSQGLNPLSGIVVPVFGAYDLAGMLLFPFVVIRSIAAERDSGALVLLLQAPVRVHNLIVAKGVALLMGWIAAGLPGLLALLWWRAMHGHLHAPEVATVLLGHLLRGALTIGIGAAAGALAASAASAAILALAFTLGTWALDYAAAARGGWFQLIAAYTPSAALRTFEQGELRASTVAVMLVMTGGGLAVAVQWLQTGRTTARRAKGLGAVLVVVVAAALASSRFRSSTDVSEDRRNSFSGADELALRRIDSPLSIEVHLSPEDPRRSDLERGVFAKLRRTMRDVRITYVARGRSGLFERDADHYGEVWYQIAGRRAMTRSATEEIVLETIYDVAALTPPVSAAAEPYPGYPLRATPAHASLAFFALWPLIVGLAWWQSRRAFITHPSLP
ncbi:MAG: ABC transporter permease subunit [Gemmatimonadota bacterium]